MKPVYHYDRLPLGTGILGIGPLPGRAGDLPGDLARIKDFAPALVISMTGTDEMAAHGAADLPQALQHAGIDWAHFPVTDFGLPDPETAQGWQAVADKALAVCAAGGRVFVHCKAGRGRSGMVAMRLMVQLGEAPGPALARLRAARPGAVETEAQQDWAQQDWTGTSPDG
ncbi:MAG: dual specificity protein phosphatase family protein [Pararhodobacter sp.]|nr:dual specificity protein phosphatase family protein [Pararhodobacter sp.]